LTTSNDNLLVKTKERGKVRVLLVGEGKLWGEGRGCCEGWRGGREGGREGEGGRAREREREGNVCAKCEECACVPSNKERLGKGRGKGRKVSVTSHQRGGL
jgi:hypothetical protein